MDMDSFNPDALSVSMPIGEIRSLLGPPYKDYAMEFGDLVGDPWQGIVLEYLGGKDERFTYNKRYRINRFVFSIAGTDTLLNNWVFEDDISP
jgi:hypothetical protein